MPDLDTILAGARSAVTDLILAGESTGSAWTTPTAPAKWSPSQLVEHVARSLEESANVLDGVPSKFPTFPAFIRPIVRVVFFNRVLRTQTFPKARTTRPMNPASGPATPADGRLRLEAALTRFEEACRTLAATRDFVPSTLFGQVSIADFARFQELHTRHHLRQMPTPMRAPHSNDG